MNKRKYFIFLFLALAVIIFFISVGKKKESRPNVILVMADALRPDHLGCYGYSRPTSPSLDSLASCATLYRSAFSSASWTIPSVYSLLTSRNFRQHQMRSWGSILKEGMPNVLTSLHRQGYSIGVFGNQDLLLKNIKQNFPDVLDGFEISNDAVEATQKALSWMKAQKKPFFLWVYYLEPHRPYRPPAPYDRLFTATSGRHLPVKTMEGTYEGGWDYLPEFMAEDNVDDPAFYVSRYDGAIRFVDEETGELLASLKKENLFDKSLIIFTSDHGESLGEHHLYFNHLYTLFNEVVKVPLLIKGTGQKKAKEVRENVGLVDIFPTILNAVSLAEPSGLEGVALQKSQPQNRCFILSAAPLGREWVRAVVRDEWKLIEYTEFSDKDTAYIKIFFPDYPQKRYQLFNIVKDQEESRNVVESEPDIFKSLNKRLSLLDKGDIRDADSDTVKDESSKKRLKSLGYAQ